MQFDQLPRDRESEPESAVDAGVWALGLAETIECVRQKIRADSLPRIASRADRLMTLPADANRHFALAGRELHRVGQQVPEHLLQALGIGAHYFRWSFALVLKLQSFCFRAGLHRGDRRFDD